MSETQTTDLIVDEFISNGNRIAIINNEAIGEEVEPEALILMKMVDDGEECTLKSLTDEEYDRAYNSYKAILELRGDDTND